jgi:hypothetical protein
MVYAVWSPARATPPDKSGSLIAECPAAGCSPVILRGSGYLETRDDCSVAVTSGTVDFGEVSVGHTATRFVSLKNHAWDRGSG